MILLDAGVIVMMRYEEMLESRHKVDEALCNKPDQDLAGRYSRSSQIKTFTNTA